MKSEIDTTNKEQALNRLCREPSERQMDTTVITSPGAGTSIWAARIQSNASYNVYNVVNVAIGDPGSEPVTMGMEAQAVNLAESFDQQGTLSSGIYIFMLRLGEKYVFYAKP